MLWRGQRESSNVDDQRSFGFGGRGLGIGGLLVGAFVVYLMGGNPLAYLLQNGATVATTQAVHVNPQQDEDRKRFAAVVLGYTEDVWSDVFQGMGREYRAPRMVLFRGGVDSACGSASSATGPFYCPSDHKVYLDLSFFDELAGKLGARGDAAAAYVIAHEVGHHVQNQLGLAASTVTSNRESVGVELQADCLAGVWAKRVDASKHVLEAGDIDSAMNGAAAVGDDRLQKRSQGYVVPDSFTHGTSEQRVSAFRAGFESGEVSACSR